jgi:hypothetical protein
MHCYKTVYMTTGVFVICVYVLPFFSLVVVMRLSVVFFQGLFSSHHQIDRVVAHPDPLFSPFDVHIVNDMGTDLPEVRYNHYAENVSFLGGLWHLFQRTVFACIRVVRGQPAPEYPHSIYLKHLNIGQHGDIDQLRLRGTGDVAFGISRGAATTFSHWALCHKPKDQPLFLLLEGCPDSTWHVLHYRYGSVIARVVEWLLERCTSYSCFQAQALSPSALVPHFPLDLPVAFVTSARDHSVPAACTHRLVEALRARGHKHVHVLELVDAGHETYYTGSTRDHDAYKAFVHMLLQRYRSGGGSCAPPLPP